MDEELRKLNFKKLLNYKGEIKPTDSKPYSCEGFCVLCEKRGLITESVGQLFQMSHAAHTSDFVEKLGDFDVKISEPIVFLLESPGSDYGNGREEEFEGVKKYPPINQYYWIPESLKQWPKEPVKGKSVYGEYFAYLMYKYGLGNVYITNVVKCSRRHNTENFSPLKYDNLEDRKVIENCVNEYLKVELSHIKPKIVFSFGVSATQLFEKNELVNISKPWFRKLHHPAYRGTSFEEYFDHNTEIIERTLKEALD